jgi:signal transduction histidine kinase
MRRHVLAAPVLAARVLLPVAVVLADTALYLAGHRHGTALWVVPAVVLVAASGYRFPVVAFVAAQVLALLAGGGYAVLLWTAYRAGRAALSRSGTAVVVGAALGALAGHVTTRPVVLLAQIVPAYLVFLALPLLAGRYLAQHERLLSALDRHNRQLRRGRALLAEQERLRERLRIARDMHDSLGHRLSLVSVQAAALEVAELPARQRQAVHHLAAAARGALTELHDLVGALRDGDEAPRHPPGAAAIGAVVADCQAAGVRVTLRERGLPRPLPAPADAAAYRVVEEGLTNATKHAPGQPVTVSVEWETDTLVVTVHNPLPHGTGGTGATDGNRCGHGLSGLGERVRAAGGLLGRGVSGGAFRLFAMLPVEADDSEADDDGVAAAPGRIRTAALGFATACLMFVILPATMLLGVG